jgi:hypothetical protein
MVMQAQTLNRVSISTASAQAFAARNLELLTAIENTIDALTGDTDLLSAISRTYSELQEKLSSFEGEIDASGRIGAMLDKASASCARIYRDAEHRHQAACTDPQLRPDDGVTDAYEAFMNAVHELHDTVESLREWVAVHDAVLQPVSGTTFESVGDLFDSLLAGK